MSTRVYRGRKIPHPRIQEQRIENKKPFLWQEESAMHLILNRKEEYQNVKHFYIGDI